MSPTAAQERGHPGAEGRVRPRAPRDSPNRQIKRLAAGLLMLLALAVSTGPTVSHAFGVALGDEPGSAPGKPQTLYRRLGGYDLITGVVDAWFGLQAKDPRFTRFRAGRSEKGLKAARQGTVDFLCQLAGGPCFYVGPDMKTVHAGLGVSDEIWQAQMTYFDEALERFQVPASEKRELLDIVASFKGVIVETSKR